MSHIFVSYSTKNKDYAYQLADALRHAGFNIWIDNHELKTGDEWWESIVLALRACAALVVIMSPDSRQSRWVQREILLAEQWEKPSFPVLLEGENFEIFVGTQFYDMRDKSLPKQSFYEQLAKYTERRSEKGIIVNELPKAQAAKDEAVREAVKNAPSHEPSKPNAATTGIYEQVEANLQTQIEWISISAGNVRLEAGGYLREDTSFSLKSYVISKYPITNAQYAEFVEAGGYENQAFWTEVGWKTRLEGWAVIDSEWYATGNPWKEPLYWKNSKFNGSEQPVIGVSWYEAVAYSAWLSESLKLDRQIVSLPTEQEWQRAAQGDDERVFPWGNQWNWRRCNSSVDGNGIGRTSAVREYEGQGDSPFGVVDMAGNVSEWCLSAYASENQDINAKAMRVLRGGSRYSTLTKQLRCANRDGADPDVRNNLIGFRVVVVAKTNRK